MLYSLKCCIQLFSRYSRKSYLCCRFYVSYTCYVNKCPNYPQVLSISGTRKLPQWMLFIWGTAIFINKVLWTSYFHLSTDISQNQCSNIGKSTGMNNKFTTILWGRNASILRIIHLKILLGNNGS